ncbi:uncharacterized protein LOC134554279 [Prinia subflava]|uniref:uncharacterized protein LOC134554279 n=1 Tax=Prinia subflava TaxID=208062 RepID=UPI002FE2EB4B
MGSFVVWEGTPFTQLCRNLFAERGCCRRQSHFLHVGHDVSGSPVSVDLGKCCSSCPSQCISSLHLSVSDLSRQSSMLDFLRSRKLHLEWLLLLQGLREVVESCHCSTCPEECLQLPALKTFFPDSPREVMIDVGKCSDPTVQGCDGLFCVPTKFSTALVKNPHGEEVVQIQENCEMKEKCYHVSQVEYYDDIVQSSAGHREEQLKEIDVGRCLGSCSSGDPCLLRESQDGEECLVWARAAPRRCAPHSYDTHGFRSRRDQVSTVSAIRECKCRG